MNIETVNDLIASLESAGELSIKDRKYLELAKAYVQLAAENVGLKAAISAVNRTAEECEVNGDELKYVVEPSEFEALTDLLDETPATDSIYAGIKADAKSHDLNAFISHYSAELDEHIANGGDQFDSTSIRLRGFIVGGRMFREKLRDEEKAQALREGAK